MRTDAIEDLGRSGISVDDATRAGIFAVDDATSVYADFKPAPALVIPYYKPDGSGDFMQFNREGQVLDFCRIRYLSIPRTTFATKLQRYAQPGKSGTRCYFAPVLDWPAVLGNTSEPVIITEGEKKALAGCIQGFPVIGLGGVWNYGGGLLELLPELDAIDWSGRDVYICFDSDARHNPNILAAESRLVSVLGTKRGAKCYIIRLPDGPGGAKQGLDDFLVNHGPDAFAKKLADTPCLSALDAKVMALNEHVAWIEKDGKVWDLGERDWIEKDNFKCGSKYSAETHVTLGAGKRSGASTIRVSEAWLTHPLAQRYGKLLFRPGDDKVIEDDNGKACLNIFDGWRREEGVKTTDPRVQAFLELNGFLFQNMDPKDRDLPLKLMIYHAQNPQQKIPLALVLIGDQGCGKSLWCECVSAAFAPHARAIPSKLFGADFNDWMENSLFITVDEVERVHLDHYGDRLKNLISGIDQNMNAKYRKARQIDFYGIFALTANDRAVGSFTADDRRMIVVNCPDKMQTAKGEALYTYLGKARGHWHKEGGPAALMGWMLDYPLQGWTPPKTPPVTAEKAMAYMEGLTPVQQLADKMRRADTHAVFQWLLASMAWAQAEEVGNGPSASAARAIATNIKNLQVRDFYTPEELMMLFPNFMAQTMATRFGKQETPGGLSRQLRNAGVRYLVNRESPMGFRHHGQVKQYLVVANFEQWRHPITQTDFDRAMQNFPTFGAMIARRPA